MHRFFFPFFFYRRIILPTNERIEEKKNERQQEDEFNHFNHNNNNNKIMSLRNCTDVDTNGEKWIRLDYYYSDHFMEIVNPTVTLSNSFEILEEIDKIAQFNISRIKII